MIFMPNHVHCIIIIDNDPVGDDFLSSPFLKTKPFMEFVIIGDGKKPSPTNPCGIILPNMNLKTNVNKTHGLSEMVRSFKHYVTRSFNELNQNRKRRHMALGTHKKKVNSVISPRAYLGQTERGNHAP